MEGILPPLPWTAARASLHVPYLACTRYQPRGGSFDDFPAHNGFLHTDDAANLVHVCETVGSLTAFLQSWLFFELLSAFLGHEIESSDFVTRGFIDLNNEPAHKHFRRWQRGVSSLSDLQKMLRREKLQALMKRATLKSEIFEEAANHFGSNDEDFDRVALSVKLLISLLSTILDGELSIIGLRSSGPWTPWVSVSASRIVRWATPWWVSIGRDQLNHSLVAMGYEDARSYLHGQTNGFRPFSPGVDRGGRAAERLHRLFVDNGWCPYWALQLCRSYDYLILNSLASLVNNPASAEDHGQCIELQRCYFHNLIVDRLDDYPFQHDDDGNQGCEFVGVSREEIKKIIRSGEIPLISMSLENDPDLQVVRCTPYTTYTAISHVWSDGLGNPRSNALPRCQLIRLRKMIFQSYFPEYSPFYDNSTIMSSIRSTTYWEFWRATRSRKPYVKIDKKRVYFWMDTLCIPVPVESETLEENKDLKFRAMRHITPVFAGAFNTLVLDKALQAVSVPNSSQVSGDEFAAIILSSKWMQRGWTLEEGALSSTCVFQMMDKPYEISGSLNHLLPKDKVHHSPLERASINVRRSIPLLLQRALLDDKKMLSQVPWASRQSRLTKLLRIPQFVWTWNSLLERSTTKLHDGPIILANLLDFNVFALKSVPHEERLKLLIENCDELPLSLLYSTGPRVSIKGHPELGWIPRSIAGDHLIVGTAIHRIKSNGIDNQVKFFVDRLNDNPESILVLGTLPGQHIPYDIELFVVRVQSERGENFNQEYIIEIQRPPIEEPGDADARRIAHRIYGRSLRTCLVIDLACGTSSRRGFTGKGTRFYVDSCNTKEMFLKYDAPLIAWTPDQWQRKNSCPQTDIPFFDTEHVHRQQRLVLKFDASIWDKRLVRRPILTQHPPTAKLIGSFALVVILLLVIMCLGYIFVTIREALGFRATPSPHATIIVYVFGPICAMFVYEPIRKRLAIYAYISWLKSFEDEYMQRQRRRVGIFSYASRFLRRVLPRWRRRTPRGLSQTSLNLVPVQDRENSTELPGEIVLQ